VRNNDMMDKEEGCGRKVGEKREGPERIMERKDMVKNLLTWRGRQLRGRG
jgi:hypothetical protein